MTPPAPVTAASMIASYGAYCSENSLTALGPNQPPRTFNKAEQMGTMTSAMVIASGITIDLRNAMAGLWSRIWLNFQVCALAMSGQVEATWSGSLATVNYAGRLGLAASDYIERSADITSGKVIYVEDDLEVLGF